ncbi:MAG TPA: ABC transporter substrate-binding protein [Candidatus Limiplasma sp.]|nr:ABC transporter substrate-binding protein [Candidatus Limiplasma sp.]HPS80232.1 ABC transporter substrate-binding protein [Candidatus Limiplasma sp.]
MKPINRLLCLLLTAILAFSSSVALAENVDDSLIVGIYSTRTTEIRPLNPQERDIVSVYGTVYESLVTVDDNGLPQPLLAETWSETGNGQTWTFTLRENVTFSDGTPLTANDVVASCKYLLAMANSEDPNARGFYQTIRYMVKDISAPDDRTVVIKAAKRTYYGLLYALTFPVVPASQVDSPNPLGTGPYVISSFEAANYIWLKVNDNWWQTKPQVKEIMVSLFSSNKDLITAYEYGRVDTAFTRSVSASQYKSGINSLSITYNTRQLETMLINNDSFPLDSVNIRKAIRAAINTSLISTNVYMGMTVTANTPISSGSWLYYDQESAFKYNLEQAQQLIADEGWSDTDGDGILDKVTADGKKNFVLRLYVYEDPENDVRFETANMIADMLNVLKIKVNVTTMTYDQEKEKLAAGAFDLALASFQMDVTPDAGFLLMKGNDANYCRYNSSEMTSLFNTLRTNQNREDYAYTMQAIQQQFANDMPFICLFYRAGAILTRKMYTTVRDIREFELLRGIEAFGR